MDAAKCDAIMDCAIDFNLCSRPSFVEQDHDTKIYTPSVGSSAFENRRCCDHAEAACFHAEGDVSKRPNISWFRETLL